MATLATAYELEQRGPIVFGSAEVHRVSVPMLEPFRISSGEVSQKNAILVRMADGAHFGWGESSAMPGSFYSTDTPTTCEREYLDIVTPALIGKRFATMAEFEKRLGELTSSSFVRVAFETAAWELLARQAGLPLREYFGLPKKELPCGLAVGLYSTEQELLEALERYRVHDYSRLKLKIKRGQDIGVVRATRTHFGSIPLFVDANADYSLADLRIFQQLDREDLMMFEQPFAKEDFEGSAALQRATHTAVCFDESIDTAADVVRAARLGACRIINIKLQRVGGYLEAFRIAEACVLHKIKLWMGTMPELGVGSAQALVMASHPGCVYPTDVEPSSRWFHGDIVTPEIVLDNRTLHLPDGLGLGFQIDTDKLSSYSLRHWSF